MPVHVIFTYDLPQLKWQHSVFAIICANRNICKLAVTTESEMPAIISWVALVSVDRLWQKGEFSDDTSRRQ